MSSTFKLSGASRGRPPGPWLRSCRYNAETTRELDNWPCDPEPHRLPAWGSAERLPVGIHAVNQIRDTQSRNASHTIPISITTSAAPQFAQHNSERGKCSICLNGNLLTLQSAGSGSAVVAQSHLDPADAGSTPRRSNPQLLRTLH